MNAQTQFGACLPHNARDLHANIRPPLSGRDICGCLDLVGLAQVCYQVNPSVPSITVTLKVGSAVLWQGEIVSVQAPLVEQSHNA